jgi:hypothetical protein
MKLENGEKREEPEMKKAEWWNGNHMKIKTDVKAFNQQIGGIGVGNVFDNVQTSSYVRCWMDKGRDLGDNNDGKNEHDRAPGVLFQFDMATFDYLPQYIYACCERIAKRNNESFILYEFHHWRKDEKIVDGYIITDYHHKYLEEFMTGPTYKSFSVLAECRPYICEVEKI